MSTRTNHAFPLRYLLPFLITGCAGAWQSALAADLALQPVQHAAAPATARPAQAAQQRPAQPAPSRPALAATQRPTQAAQTQPVQAASERPAQAAQPAQTASERLAHVLASRQTQPASGLSNGAESIGARATPVNHPLVTASDRASAARARFDDARAAMERAILLSADGSTASVAAIDAAMKDLSADLAIIERMPRTQPTDTARTALNLVQAWYGDGMKIVQPPPQGLLEVPLPMNVRRKAEAVASTLDKLVAEAAAPVQPQTIASAKDRASTAGR